MEVLSYDLVEKQGYVNNHHITDTCTCIFFADRARKLTIPDIFTQTRTFFSIHRA